MRIRQTTTHLAVAALLAAVSRVALADDAPGYEPNVRPILQARCLSCHNPEKRKGGLDMTTYQSLLAGGSGGKIVAPGQPADSALLGVIQQTREPRMPPSGNKMPDAEIDLIRKWIEQGCRETPQGPAIAAEDKPTAQPLEIGALTGVSTQLPLAWPLAEIVEAERTDAVTSIASHPGVPVLAVAGQQQILVYHLPTEKLLGALSTRPGFPLQVRFSVDGRLLISAGGVAATSGFVRAWNVATGDVALNIEHDMEAVRAADIDADLRWCAFGGPSGVVLIQDLKTAQIVDRIRKHTDWITDIAFSPDGLLLATADRAGGVFIWEAESHNLMHALPTHPGAVTALAWRGDSNLLATACEDGQIRVYEPEGGAGVKGWSAHPGGVMCVRWSHDGKLVSVGRDRVAKLWKPDFGHARSTPAFDDIALACAFSSDGNRIIATDFSGAIRVFDLESGAVAGQLNANPAPFAQQLASAQKLTTEATQREDASRRELDTARAAFDNANRAHDEASLTLKKNETELKRLRAAEMRAQLQAVRNELAAARRDHKPVRDAATEAQAAAAAASQALAAARDALAAIDKSIATNATTLESTNARIAALNGSQTDVQKRVDDSRVALEQLDKAVRAVQQQLSSAPESESLKASLEHASQAKASMEAEIASLQGRLESINSETAQLTTTLASLTSQATAGREQQAAAAMRVSELETALTQATEAVSTRQAAAEEAAKAEDAIAARIKASEDAYHALLAEVAAALGAAS